MYNEDSMPDMLYSKNLKMIENIEMKLITILRFYNDSSSKAQ